LRTPWAVQSMNGRLGGKMNVINEDFDGLASTNIKLSSQIR